MDEADRDTIRKYINDVAKDMDFDAVATCLYSKGIFEEDHIDKFKSKPTEKMRSLELLLATQKRGPKAFPALCDCLVEAKQPHLAELLRPSSSAADAMPSGGSYISKPIPQPGSPMDISSSETVALNYKMSSKPLGVAVIINNKDFKGMPTRTGTDKDRDNLKAMFEYLGFTPHIKNNQTGKEIKDTIERLSKVDHSQIDCVAVAILSHGKEGVVYGTDGYKVEILKLIHLFNGCLSLKGKPKLFLIQACRGEMQDAGVEAPDGVGPAGDGGINLQTEAHKLLQIEDDSTDVLGAVKSKIPNQTDMLIGYSTIPGFVSWRNNNKGSWFIQALTEVTRQHAEKEDLGSMMTMVNDRVAEKASSRDKCKQTSVFTSSLRKKLFFFPSQ